MVSKGLSYKSILRVLRVLRGYLFIFLLLALITRPNPIKAGTFFKSPDDVEKILKEGQGDFLIVDIRPPIFFEKKSIISSINIPGILLKNKTFLKNKKILLIDEGIDYCSVKKLGQELVENGFPNVYALEGGIRYYQYKNKQLQIIEDGLKQRYGLDVVLLQKVLHCKDQSPLLVDIRENEGFTKNRIEGSIWFDYRTDEDAGMKEALKKKTDKLFTFITNELKNKKSSIKTNSTGNENKDLKDLSDETRHPVILIDTNGEETPRLARLLSKKGINVFYLIDGMESWDLYTKEIPEVRKREAQKKESGCKECN